MRFGEQFRALIRASDYDPSIAFYGEMLGLDVYRSWDHPHGKGTVFRAGSGLIEISTGQGSMETRGLCAIVIQVEDADATYRELTARGASAGEPFTAPWGHRLVRLDGPDGTHLIFFQELQA